MCELYGIQWKLFQKEKQIKNLKKQKDSTHGLLSLALLFQY
jgi:hypothetical protein